MQTQTHTQTNSKTGEEVAVVLLNEGGILLDAHAACSAAFGWSRPELLGKDIRQLLQCGHDLLMQQLVNFQEENDFANGHTSFSIRVLARRKDDTHFPARVVIRRFPQLECFTAAFYPAASDTEGEAAPTIRPEEIVLAISSNKESTRALRERAQIKKEKPRETSVAPVQPENSTPAPAQPASPPPPQAEQAKPASAESPAQAASQGQGAPPVQAAPPTQTAPPLIAPSAGADLEKEREARRRAEARIAALNEQLRQLHQQLGENLESEKACQTKIIELEQRAEKSEQQMAEAKNALADEQAKRQLAEQQFKLLKDLNVRSEETRAAIERSHQELCSRLKSSLAALKKSEERLRNELNERNGIEEIFAKVQRDFTEQNQKEKAELTQLQSAFESYLDMGIQTSTRNGSPSASLS